jgi:glycosyltransferase involved in cell wall biosynthesis
VAAHVRALAKHLPAFGWELVPRPDGNALVHCHAMERAPEIDAYTNHGVYPIRPGMPRWQQEANAAIFDNLKLANQVIAVSQWTAAQWQGLTGVQPSIIPNGVDLEQWRRVPRGRWRARLQVPDGMPILLWGKSGLSDVLDPTPAIELALRHPEIRVVMPLEPRLLTSAPKNLACVGPQPFPDMQALIADCDVYLGTVCENHAVQVLEAMALGKPILGYDWGGTGETIRHGVEGLLVQPGDLDGLSEALPQALERAKELGAAGRQTVAERYQWKDLVRQLAGVYELALAARARRDDPAVPTCSVIIPCYNKAPYVGEAIRSVLAQRGTPAFELIVVDDGSKDASLEAIWEAAGHDARIQVIAQANAGVAAARNNGIAVARGRYICCLDADDRIEPSFLARLSAALDADPGLGIAYSDMVAFGDWPDRGPWQNLITCSDYDFEKLKRGNFIPCCNLFRRVAWERAGGYKDINPSWEDYELWLNMGKLGWPGRRVPGGLFGYRKLFEEGRDHESHGHEWRLRAIVNTHHRDLYPPAVSFVIPCYDQSTFLAEAINSALGQTFPDLEVVVVDDGNDEEEAGRIRTLVESYDSAEVRLVRLRENSGLAEARNTGIRAARGQWIVPLDADDLVDPAFVAECLRAIKLDPNGFAYSDARLWWPVDGKEQLLQAHEYDFGDLLRRITWPCTILYARDAWRQAGGYKPQMSDAGGWEDWEFAITLGELGVCGVRVPRPLFTYRQHSANQMRFKAEKQKPALQEAMRRLHAQVYRGEFPMGCCGGGRRSTPAPESAPQQAAPPQNGTGAGTVLVRYTGQSYGTQVWVGPSGRAYQFGGASPLQNVLAGDVDSFTQRRDFRAVTA